MAIDPRELVRYAQDLYKANRDEIDREVQLRTAINRAYYGAFLTARDSAGISFSQANVHIAVASHYRDEKNGIVANNLDSLKRLRQKADYEPGIQIGVSEAKTSCSTAQRIVNEINKLAAKSSSGQIKPTG